MTTQQTVERVVVMVPAELIDAGPNHRTVFDPEKLQSLATSIERDGLAQPITVRPMPTGRYQIVAGERRFRATQLLGWREVPAMVRELDDEQANAIMLAENTGREDLDPMDEARAYKRTMDDYGWSMTRVAETAGVSASKVKNRLKLLELLPEIQRLVAQGQMAVGLAEEMSILSPAYQREAFGWLSQQTSTPSRRTFARVVQELYAAQQQAALFDLSQFQLDAQVLEALAQGDGHLRQVIPRRPDLPGLPNKSGPMGKVIDDYIVELLKGGHQEEARVMMHFWRELMNSNYATLSPAESELIKRFGVRLS